MWVYLAALFIAYPVGLAGAIMWYMARKTGKFAKLNHFYYDGIVYNRFNPFPGFYFTLSVAEATKLSV